MSHHWVKSIFVSALNLPSFSLIFPLLRVKVEHGTFKVAIRESTKYGLVLSNYLKNYFFLLKYLKKIASVGAKFYLMSTDNFTCKFI